MTIDTVDFEILVAMAKSLRLSKSDFRIITQDMEPYAAHLAKLMRSGKRGRTKREVADLKSIRHHAQQV